MMVGINSKGSIMNRRECFSGIAGLGILGINLPDNPLAHQNEIDCDLLLEASKQKSYVLKIYASE
jgi:hypothetical protein